MLFTLMAISTCRAMSQDCWAAQTPKAGKQFIYWGSIFLNIYVPKLISGITIKKALLFGQTGLILVLVILMAIPLRSLSSNNFLLEGQIACVLSGAGQLGQVLITRQIKIIFCQTNPEI